MSAYPQDLPPKYEDINNPYPPPPQGYASGPPPPGMAGGYPAPPQAAGYPAPPQMGGYPPVQAGYQQQQQPGMGYPAGQTTVIVSQPHLGPRDGGTIRYSQSPALIVCQHCRATVTTAMEYEVGLLSWAVCGGLCIFGCWLGCCLVPFCIDGTKDVKHTCPNCQKVVGHFRHFN